MKEKKRVINKKTFALLLTTIILTSGILAVNIDHIYAASHSRLSAILPSDYAEGETVSFPVLLSDINGNPREEKEIRVFLEGDEKTSLVYNGYTSKKGICDVEFKLPEGDFQGEILVKGGRETIRRDISIEGGTRLFVSTDKPIYKPGQSVHMRSLCFVGNEPLGIAHGMTYTVTTPEGDRIFRKNLYPNEYGITWYNYSLSKILPHGAYELEVKALDKTIKQVFLVHEYVLPKIRMNFRGLDDWYLYGDSISGTLEAFYFFGKNTDGTVSIEMYANDRLIDERSGTLEDGQMPFIMKLPSYAEYSMEYVTLNATVTDTSGYTQWSTIDIPISRNAIHFDMVSTKNIVGLESVFDVRVTYPDGKPVVDLVVTARLGDEYLGTNTTGENGLISWKSVYEGEDRFRVAADYGERSYSKNFVMDSDYGIKLVPLSGGNEVGDLKDFLVYYRGSSLTSRIYYTLQTQRNVLYSDYIVMDQSPIHLSIPVVYEMAPAYRLNVYTIESDLSYSTDSVTVDVDLKGYLDLQIETDRDIYGPGEKTAITFGVLDRGLPTAAALEVKITDEALYSLHHLSGMDRILSKDTDDRTESGFEIITVGMTSEHTELIKQRWIYRYLSFIFILCFIGFIILLYTALKHGKSAPLAIAVVIMLLAMPAYGLFASLPSADQADSTSDGRTYSGMSSEGDPSFADDEEAFDTDFSRPPPPSSGTGDDKSEDQVDSATPRQHFPETWYWNPCLITDNDGMAELTLTTPDSITNWLVEGTASTLSGEFTGNTVNLTVFKDLFIEPDIPVSVVRNDEFELRAMVYNYLNQTAELNVVLEGEDWFTLHDSNHKKLELESGEVGNVTYSITPLDVGEHTIRLRVSAPSGAQDAVYRNMMVKPDGQREVDVYSGQLTDDDLAQVDLVLDSDSVIPGSESAYIKLFGSMNSVTLDSAEGFIRKVRGCGEQSMSTFSINVLAYEIAVNSDDPPENMEHYESLVVQGVQHQLGFLKIAEDGSGRGIVWFPNDQDVHPWLTSWGLLTFQDARDAGLTIDGKIITDMQDWLVSQQNSDGSWEFPEWGLYETTSSTLRTKKVATTAYITRSLLYSGYDKSSSAVNKGLDYISNNIDDQWNDPYTLSIAAICYKLANQGGSEYKSMLEQIDSLKTEENGTVYWKSDSSMLQDSRSYYGSSGSKIIETTGYALMALSREGYHDTTDKAVQYLIENRNEFGTFYTTQDTVVALQALKETGEIEIEEVTVAVSVNGETVENVTVTEENRDLTFYLNLVEYISQGENTITLFSEGTGKVSYQVVYVRYTEWDIMEKTSIGLDVVVPFEIGVGEIFTLSFELTYGQDAPYSKMGILAIPLPTGFTPLDHDHLLEKEHISNWEVEMGELRIYLTDMFAGTISDFDIELVPSFTGEIQLQGINYYDMYSPEIETYVEPGWITVRSLSSF